jgi:hypothetical protein
MTMFEIKKIKKISLANIAASLYALFAFIGSFGASIYAIVFFVHGKQFDKQLALYILTNLGLGFLIALAAAIIAAILGWLMGFIAAGFYNFIVKTTGGLKIELVDEAGQAMAFKPEEKKQELFKY